MEECWGWGGALLRARGEESIVQGLQGHNQEGEKGERYWQRELGERGVTWIPLDKLLIGWEMGWRPRVCYSPVLLNHTGPEGETSFV